MKLRNLYLANSIIMLVLALGLILMTSVMVNLFGVNNGAETRTLSQLLGVGLVVSGMITLLAREVTDPMARSAINFSNLIADVLGVVVALNATLTGVFGWFGWLLVVVYLLLALGFGYFQFLAPPQ
jgi:ABC-type transport system involved in multi-copper enzyme maturation permease subunit